MCWVMPPASPSATLVLRIWSRSEVLPWSTWPMTVTTGARGSLVPASSPSASSCSSCWASSKLTSMASTPSSSASSRAVSGASTWLMLAMTPFLNRSWIRSLALTPSFSANSRTVIASETITGPSGFFSLNGRTFPSTRFSLRFLRRWARLGWAALAAAGPAISSSSSSSSILPRNAARSSSSSARAGRFFFAALGRRPPRARRDLRRRPSSWPAFRPRPSASPWLSPRRPLRGLAAAAGFSVAALASAALAGPSAALFGAASAAASARLLGRGLRPAWPPPRPGGASFTSGAFFGSSFSRVGIASILESTLRITVRGRLGRSGLVGGRRRGARRDGFGAVACASSSRRMTSRGWGSCFPFKIACSVSVSMWASSPSTRTPMDFNLKMRSWLGRFIIFARSWTRIFPISVTRLLSLLSRTCSRSCLGPAGRSRSPTRPACLSDLIGAHRSGVAVTPRSLGPGGLRLVACAGLFAPRPRRAAPRSPGTPWRGRP